MGVTSCPSSVPSSAASNHDSERWRAWKSRMRAADSSKSASTSRGTLRYAWRTSLRPTGKPSGRRRDPVELLGVLGDGLVPAQLHLVQDLGDGSSTAEASRGRAARGR